MNLTLIDKNSYGASDGSPSQHGIINDAQVAILSAFIF